MILDYQFITFNEGSDKGEFNQKLVGGVVAATQNKKGIEVEIVTPLGTKETYHFDKGEHITAYLLNDQGKTLSKLA